MSDYVARRSLRVSHTLEWLVGKTIRVKGTDGEYTLLVSVDGEEMEIYASTEGCLCCLVAMDEPSSC